MPSGRGGFRSMLWYEIGLLINVCSSRQSPHDVEEYRCEKDSKQGYAQHAEENRNSQRASHLGAGTVTDDERDDAENEGEAGHDDRPQPQLARFERGFSEIGSCLAPRLGELDDENGVLARQPHQHDETHLCEDVDVESREENAGDRTE